MTTSAIETTDLREVKEPSEFATMDISRMTETHLKVWLGLLYFARNDIESILFSKEGPTPASELKTDTKAKSALKSKVDSLGRHEANLSELVALSCPGLERNTKKLKAVIEELECVKVRLNVIGKSKKMEVGAGCRLIAGFNFVEKPGYVLYDFSAEIKKVLTTTQMWRKLSLAIVSKLQTKGTIGLYRLCNDYRGIHQTGEIELEALKKILGCGGKNSAYKEFADFNQKVLKPSIARVNEGTDLRIKEEFVKEGKKVVAVRFQIDPQYSFSFKPPAEKSVKMKRVKKPKFITNDKAKDLIITYHQIKDRNLGTWNSEDFKQRNEILSMLKDIGIDPEDPHYAGW